MNPNGSGGVFEALLSPRNQVDGVSLCQWLQDHHVSHLHMIGIDDAACRVVASTRLHP